MKVSILLVALLMSGGFPGLSNENHHRWVEPGNDPDRIILSMTEYPEHSIAVSWRTSADVKKGWGEISRALAEPGFTSGAERFEATTVSLDRSQLSYNPTNHVAYHTIKFSGLKPGTQYAYRVGDGKDFMSEWYHFTTAREGFAPFSFVYVGDAQNGLLSHWSRLVRQAFKSEPEMSFFLHAGDLINTAHMDSEWGEWFHALGWIHGMVPAVAVPGNHEYGRIGNDNNAARGLSIQCQPQFEFPRVDELPEKIQETAYSFVYQGTLFIALNSMDHIEEQTSWMAKLLEESTHQWKVVTFHYPIFASGINRDNIKLRSAWKPVFDKYNVDLVLQGHDHTYARGHTRLIKAGPIEDYVRTVYVNSVSGSKMYPLKPDRWTSYNEDDVTVVRMAENTQLFQVIEIDHRTISYKAVLPTGEVYDSFSLEKLPDGSKKMTNGFETLVPERTFKNTMPYGK